LQKSKTMPNRKYLFLFIFAFLLAINCNATKIRGKGQVSQAPKAYGANSSGNSRRLYQTFNLQTGSLLMNITDIKKAAKNDVTKSVEKAIADTLVPVTIYRRLEGYKGLNQTEYAMLTAGTLAACGFWDFTAAGAARAVKAQPSAALCELAGLGLDSTMVGYWTAQGLMLSKVVKTSDGKQKRIPQSLTPKGIAKLAQRFADYASTGKGFTCSPAHALAVKAAVIKGAQVREKDNMNGDRLLRLDITSAATVYAPKAPTKAKAIKAEKPAAGAPHV